MARAPQTLNPSSPSPEVFSTGFIFSLKIVVRKERVKRVLSEEGITDMVTPVLFKKVSEVPERYAMLVKGRKRFLILIAKPRRNGDFEVLQAIPGSISRVAAVFGEKG